MYQLKKHRQQLGHIHRGYLPMGLYLSQDSCQSTIAEGSIKDRTIQSMMNIGEILKEAGSSLDKVVKTTIFVTNLELFGEVNEAYGTFFGGNAPARACVQVAALPKGADIEIEAIATV